MAGTEEETANPAAKSAAIEQEDRYSTEELSPLKAAQRFPVPLLCAFALAWVGFAGSPLVYQAIDPWIQQTVFSAAAAGFCASLLVALAGEARGWQWWTKAGLGLLAVVALVPVFEPRPRIREISLHPAALMLGGAFLMLAILTPALLSGARTAYVIPFTRAVTARLTRGIWVATLLSLPALAMTVLLPRSIYFPSLPYEQAKIVWFMAVPIWAWWFLAGCPGRG